MNVVPYDRCCEQHRRSTTKAAKTALNNRSGVLRFGYELQSFPLTFRKPSVSACARMNWMRYHDGGARRRPTRGDRERWVHDKLKQAIELKEEQTRLGIRPKLTRTAFDPKRSYFLRKLIHLDKATGMTAPESSGSDFLLPHARIHVYVKIREKLR